MLDFQILVLSIIVFSPLFRFHAPQNWLHNQNDLRNLNETLDPAEFHSVRGGGPRVCVFTLLSDVSGEHPGFWTTAVDSILSCGHVSLPEFLQN